MTKCKNRFGKGLSLSLIFWIIVVICSGGAKATKGVWWYLIMRVSAKEGKKGEGRKDASKHRVRTVTGDRQTDKQGERTVAPRFIQNGLNDGDNGGAQSAKRKPNPPRPFCSLRPSHPMETGSLDDSKLTRVENLLSGGPMLQHQ